MHNPGRKSRSRQRVGEIKEVASMERQESHQEVNRAGTTRRPNSSFSTLMNLCHLKNSAPRPKFQKCKGCCCAETRCHEGRFRLVCSVHHAGIFSVANDGGECSGLDFRTARMTGTSKRRSVSLYSSQIGARTQNI